VMKSLPNFVRCTQRIEWYVPSPYRFLNKRKREDQIFEKPPPLAKWEISEAEKQRKLEEYREKRRREMERENAIWSGKDWKT
jgi:hypothetical protein